MKKNPQKYNDEINLVDLFNTIWEGKWKIVAIMIIVLLFTFLFIIKSNDRNPQVNFTAKTLIAPISWFDQEKYSNFNKNLANDNLLEIANLKKNLKTTNFKKNQDEDHLLEINRKKLYNLFIEILNEGSLFEEAVNKFGLLDADQYVDEKLYDQAVSSLVSTIKFEPYKNDKINNSYKSESDSFLVLIKFTYYDREKWKNVLLHVNEQANKALKQDFQNLFRNHLTNKIELQKTLIEDLSKEIENLIADYDRLSSDKILYLEEQSEIAKELGIEKNTLEVVTFGNDNSLVSSMNTDSQFYLRGYKAIDKEIKLIQSRLNKKAFIEGLYNLEKKKREIEQDQSLNRLKIFFEATPLGDNNQIFHAATIKTLSTEFEDKKIETIDDKKAILIAIFIGLIIGIIYIIIGNTLQIHRISKKKTN